MSLETKRLFGADETIHDRARMLAAESVDGSLAPGDAEWLDAHLGACPDCAAVAEEYRAIHLELGSLATPEPPRDLWARTSAALD
jgi:anti-sigma factor RsiW